MPMLASLKMKKNSRGGTGKGPKNGKSQDKSRRQIKNARGLRDVLGVAGEAKESPKKSHGSKARSSDRPTDRPSDRPVGRSGEKRSVARRGKRVEEEPNNISSPRPQMGQSKGPASKKITYITSFQPPSDMRPEPTVDSPRRFSSSTAPASEPGPNRKPIDLHDRSDFRWPKERLTPAKSERPDKSRATGEPQKKSHGRGGVSRVQGIVKRHPDGFGFLIPDVADHPDVYISRQYMTGIMTNDRVEVEVFQSRKEDRFYGEIRRVVSRASTRIVGEYLPVDRKYGVILDDGRGWGADLRIPTQDSMGAHEGALVAVEITQYPGPDSEFTGRVIGILGDVEDPINDVKRVIYSQGIPDEFSTQAIQDARKFGGVVTEAEMAGRVDLRDKTLITIDGVTAKDFDDAIWVEQTPSGFHLIVAIADVSHYVKPGSKLDQEAYERGTSTYFPNYVVPMLPEELSNELCSLKPHVPRLCFACEMDLNFQGEVQDYRFFEGIMESKARVTYGEAQEVIDGSTPEKLRHVEEMILKAADLAKILMAKRFREGSLDLEIPETQVVVDPSGETTDIIKSNRLFAHRLIEELMLVTNICTARFMDENEIPGIYRIHEEPDEDNIKALQRYLWNLGGSRSVMGSNLQKKLTKALQAMEGQPGAQVLHVLTLRTMKQAQYSNENVGHFGLGFSHYSHFTSPIRRYPDLIAHRLIKSQLYPRYHSMEMTDEELASAATMLSACEQRSVKAERQVISIKKARFMRQFIGQEFEGLISSVTKFGIFVLLRQYDVDGLVKIDGLGNDRFLFDEENLRLIGQRSGRRFGIGDRVWVAVLNSDPVQGRIDLGLSERQIEQMSKEDIDDPEFDELEDERPKEKRRGTRKAAKTGAKDKFDDQKRRPKRGEASNDRRSIRKKRVSRRRRKD